MYTLVSSITLNKNIDAQWTVTDLSSILVCDIFNQFNSVFLTLSNIYLTSNVYIDLNSLKTEFASYTGTIPQLLSSLGNRTLVTVPSLPGANTKYASYADAFLTGYKANLALIGTPVTNNTPRSLLKDVVLTRPYTTTNMSLIHNKCLVTVNGFLHRTDTDGTNAYIYDGGKSLQVSNDSNIGILSFLDILGSGNITKLPLTLADIHNQGGLSPLRERTYLRVNQDITNKTVLLSLGGYLILPDPNIFWRSGVNTYALNWNGMPILERYFDSLRYLDMSSLGLDVSTINPDVVNIAQFFSDVVLQRYLMLSQSFLIIIDTPTLFTNKRGLRNTGFNNLYTSFTKPTSPLITSYGKISEYWSIHEDGQYSISVSDSLYRNYVMSNTPLDLQTNVSPALVPGKQYKNSNAFFIDFYTL